MGLNRMRETYMAKRVGGTGVVTFLAQVPDAGFVTIPFQVSFLLFASNLSEYSA